MPIQWPPFLAQFLRSEKRNPANGLSWWRRPMTLTLAAALLLPVIVFVYLAATTSDWAPSQRKITTWQIGEKLLRDTGEGITFSLDKEPIRLFHTTHLSKPAIYSSFSCELYLQNPRTLQVILF